MKINEKNLSIFANSPPYDLCSYLLKRGEVNKAFQKRYFVLKGNLLFYFEKQGDREPQGLILLEGCTIALSQERGAYCFEIAFGDNRTYVLCADTQSLMEEWMKKLTCAGYEYKKLIIAELQRKLSEIEGSRNSQPFSQQRNSSTADTKTLPAQRTNPFLRPAPSPPVAANHTSAETQNIECVSNYFSKEPQDTSANVNGLPINGLDNGFPRAPPRTKSQPRTCQPAAAGLRPIHPEAFSFMIFHQRYGAPIVRNMQEYRMRLQPLIEY